MMSMLVEQKLLLVANCLVCLAVCWINLLTFEGTEFGHGSLAGDKDLAGYLFVVALILLFKYPRAAAIAAFVACANSLPLYLCLVFPRPFRQVSHGNWKVMALPTETFVWDVWWITGILSIAVAAFISGRMIIGSLSVRGAPASPSESAR